MRPLIQTLSLGLAILITGSIAVAQGPGNADRMGQNRQGGFGNPIARFDTDKDGVLSTDEVTVAKNSNAGRFIQMMDRNTDGQIDADEVKAFKDRMRSRMSERMSDRMGSEKSNSELAKGLPRLKDPDHLIFLYMNGTVKDQNQAKDAYIIDSDGKILHRWDNSNITSPESAPGYLTPDGLFLRGIKSDGAEQADFAVGAWGTLQLVDWDGTVVWEYDSFKEGKECFHHDVALMPNGNILATAFRKYTEQEAAAFGWNTQGQSKVLFDIIYEIKPNLTDGTTEIIWQWNWTDHVIQELDDALPNYGTVAENPGKIDLHFYNSRDVPFDQVLGTHSHFNSIDYNPERDEILVSSGTYDEIYIIDHSTTTEEAASSRGGKRGKGGDILYRWGNPAAYRYGGGDAATYKEWRWTDIQHDARWVLDGSGNITVHNNNSTKNQRPGGMMNAWTQFLEIRPPYAANGYTYNPGRPYGPMKPMILAEYNPEIPLFNSMFAGGGQKLKNGHVFTTSAAKFTLLEHDENGEIVWFFDLKDIHPAGGQVFKAQKYPADYSGFSRLKRSGQTDQEVGSAHWLEEQESK